VAGPAGVVATEWGQPTQFRPATEDSQSRHQRRRQSPAQSAGERPAVRGPANHDAWQTGAPSAAVSTVSTVCSEHSLQCSKCIVHSAYCSECAEHTETAALTLALAPTRRRTHSAANNEPLELARDDHADTQTLGSIGDLVIVSVSVSVSMCAIWIGIWILIESWRAGELERWRAGDWEMIEPIGKAAATEWQPFMLAPLCRPARNRPPRPLLWPQESKPEESSGSQRETSRTQSALEAGHRLKWAPSGKQTNTHSANKWTRSHRMGSSQSLAAAAPQAPNRKLSLAKLAPNILRMRHSLRFDPFPRSAAHSWGPLVALLAHLLPFLLLFAAQNCSQETIWEPQF